MSNNQTEQTWTELGEITLSGKVVVADPSQSFSKGLKDKNLGVLENILPGEYYCTVRREGEGKYTKNRISHLTLINSSFLEEVGGDMEGYELTYLDFCIAVNIGEAGVFDYDYYMKEVNGNNEWCEKYEINNSGAIVDDKAVISSSGMGDGEYYCLVTRNKDGKIIEIVLDFVNEIFEKLNNKTE